MKVLRLDGGTAEPGEDQVEIHLPLHPLMTVVAGAAGEARRAVIDAIASVPRGDAPLGGMIEVDGTELPLAAESLRRLGLGGSGAPQVVVRAADLPGYDAARGDSGVRRQNAQAARDEVVRALYGARAAAEEADQARARAQAVLDDLRAGEGEAVTFVEGAAAARDDAVAHADAAAAERGRLEDELARLDGELEAARAAEAAAEGSLAAARERRQAAVAAATQAAAELEEAQTGAGPDAEEVLAQAEERLVELEAEPMPDEVPAQPWADDDVDATVTVSSSERDSGGGELDDAGSDDGLADASAASDGAAGGSSGDAALTAADLWGPEQGGVADAQAEPVAADRSPVATVELTPLVRRISEREARRDDLTRRLVAVAVMDAAAVRSALAHIRRSEGAEPVPVPAAMTLADEWRDLHAQFTELTSSETDEHREARSLLEEARRAAAEAEDEMRVPDLQPDQVAALEAAHAEVLDAQEKSDARFGGARARKRLEDARSSERTVLDQLGFTTYADFMMSTSSRGLGAAKQAILDSARNRLAEAEARWRAGGGDPTESAQYAELLDRRATLAPAIAELIGHEPAGPEAEEELRSLRHTPVVDETALERLRSSLTTAGVELADEDLDQAELVRVAEVWLDEHGRLDERRAAFEAELSEIDDELIDLWQAQERGETAVPGEPEEQAPAPIPEPDEAGVAPAEATAQPSPEQARHAARIEDAHSAVTAARQRAAQQRELVERMERFAAALAERATEEQEAATASEEAEQASTEARGRVEELVNAIASLHVAHTEAMAVEQAAVEALAAFEAPDASEDPLSRLLTRQEEELAEAERRAVAAEREVDRLSAELALAEDRLVEADEAVQAVQVMDEDAMDGQEEMVEEVEWYLLARLAAQRSVADAGSVPMLLDDPFRELRPGASVALVAELERMSTAVQLIIVTDDPALARWATDLGPEHAAVVTLA